MKTIDHIANFNKMRIALYGKEITILELKQNLHNIKVPCNNIFITELIKIGIINKISKNIFIFNNSPVYYELLDNAYKNYRKRIVHYQNNAQNKKENKEAKIIEAIAFLKLNNFEIFKKLSNDNYTKF